MAPRLLISLSLAILFNVAFSGRTQGRLSREGRLFFFRQTQYKLQTHSDTLTLAPSIQPERWSNQRLGFGTSGFYYFQKHISAHSTSPNFRWKIFRSGV